MMSWVSSSASEGVSMTVRCRVCELELSMDTLPACVLAARVSKP